MDAGKFLFEVPTLCLEYTLNAAHNDQMREVCTRILQMYGAPHASGLRPAGLSAAELHLALQTPRPFLRQLDLSHTQSRVRDNTLELVAANYHNLHSLCLLGCVHVTDYGLQRLAPLAGTLNSLDARGCVGIGPNTAVSISALTTLRALKIPHISTIWRDPQLCALTRMQTLTLLHISNDIMNTVAVHVGAFDEEFEDNSFHEGFGDRVVAAIAALATLQHLHICAAEGSRTSFMPFSQLTQLTYLHINGLINHPRLTAQEVEALSASPALRTLQLPYPRTYTPFDVSEIPHLRDLESIDFHGDTSTFIAQLGRMPNLTALRFRSHYDSPLHPEHLHFLSNHLPFLASIQLQGTTVTGPLALSYITGGRCLHTLHLGALESVDTTALTLLPHLQTLQLHRQTELPDINPFLLLPSLTSLTIPYHNLGDTLPPITTHCPTLQRLHLSYCPLPGSFLTSLPAHLPSLNSLSITVHPCLVRAPAEQLQGLTALADLVTLDVTRFCTTSGADLAALVGMPKLRDLRVHGWGLTAEDLMDVVPDVGRSLQVLELQGCAARGQDWDVFVEACPDVVVRRK